VRRYRPFLVYNPTRGWAFYRNPQVTNYTHKTIGSHRKTMRELIGWFPTAEIAARFEKVAQGVR
jgi:hypothetical protein